MPRKACKPADMVAKLKQADRGYGSELLSWRQEYGGLKKPEPDLVALQTAELLGHR